jgi:hypothetical protein
MIKQDGFHSHLVFYWFILNTILYINNFFLSNKKWLTLHLNRPFENGPVFKWLKQVGLPFENWINLSMKDDHLNTGRSGIWIFNVSTHKNNHFGF